MYADSLRGCCDVDEAEDGREALAKVFARHPDVIVTETRLPGINGFDLCRLLRRDAQTRDIPIVVVTGDVFDADVSRARNAGADTVLTKPCLPEQLAAEIRRVLRQSDQLRARGRALREPGGISLARSTNLQERPAATPRRVSLSRAHQRYDTASPPAAPPALSCPTCDRPLRYVKSHIGGVNQRHPEQWDDFECESCRRTFQYRHRTRRLQRVV